jgi:hypothetical protein
VEIELPSLIAVYFASVTWGTFADPQLFFLALVFKLNYKCNY